MRRSERPLLNVTHLLIRHITPGRYPHVNVSPLIASACGSLNHKRLVLWFTTSLPSSCNETKAGPLPRTFTGALDSALAVLMSAFEKIARPIPPKAILLMRVMGWTRRSAEEDMAMEILKNSGNNAIHAKLAEKKDIKGSRTPVVAFFTPGPLGLARVFRYRWSAP